jgi:uncharacterized protein (DUF1015 family)
MPLVAPFRGLHYSLDRFGSDGMPERVRLPGDADPPPQKVADLTDVVCPPYDVIDDAMREELLERDAHNAVRLELSPEPDPHAGAAATLRTWLDERVLARREEPAFYAYRHATAADPDVPTVEGVLARVRLEPWGSGVRPHEHTMPGPKADRLALLHATRTQLSPILSVYFDRSERYHQVTSRGWTDEWRARDGDGLLHQCSATEADDGVAEYLGGQTFYVADGHHRYETALAYQAEVRADPRWADAPAGSLAADWTMMQLVNAERVELEIRPTHRLLLDVNADALRDLIAGDDPLWQSLAIDPAKLSGILEEHANDEAPTFGLVLPGDDGHLLVGDPDGLADRLRREAMSREVRELDLAALHVAVLGDRLGIGPEEVAAGTRLAYTRSETDARERVARGEASAAILVRPTRLEQLAAVAAAGDVMPQKSTYFYPKLLTGLVFNPLED